MELNGTSGLKLREYEKKGPTTNSSSIAMEIKTSTKNPVDKSLRVLIGKKFEEKGMELYPLLIVYGTERP